MRAASVLATLLLLVGSVLLGAALLAAAISIQALLERHRHGPGLFFSDVEILAFLAVACALAGGLALLGAKLLWRRELGKER
jgi:hypothetical protein